MRLKAICILIMERESLIFYNGNNRNSGSVNKVVTTDAYDLKNEQI